MDINDMRSVVTVISLVAFIGITVWAWQRSRREAFDEAAALPFIDEPGADAAGRSSTGEHQ
jgi:cytochrome c oxidase cbb3-type subunit 4